MQQNQQIDEINNKMEGSVLKQRYTIGRLIDKGSFGHVYKCIDIQNQSRHLVVKVANDYKQFGNEINAMRRISKKQTHHSTNASTPEVVEYGMILFKESPTEDEEKLLSYMIMPRYGHNLETIFERSSCRFSNASILSLALATLDMLESVHSAGYVYNDLKLDNLMMGLKNKKVSSSFTEENIFATADLHLVDFGFATRYSDKVTGHHFEQAEVQTFRGNIIFGSLNQLNFKSTSRRDDLISMLYMMVYMLNQGKLTGIDLESQLSSILVFKATKKAKESHTLADLCCDNASIMTKFAEEVLSYKFKDEPRYSKLREILHKAFEATPRSLDSTSSSIDDNEYMEGNTEEGKMEVDQRASIIPQSNRGMMNKVRSFFN
jgi:casein kinase 1